VYCPPPRREILHLQRLCTLPLTSRTERLCPRV
jgi:hypothetical protein